MKEVYIAFGKNCEVLYVGQGNIGRSSHCVSGASHNRSLNEYFFTHGSNSVKVKVLYTLETQEQAIIQEKYLINKLNPLFNRTCTSTYKEVTTKPNFKLFAKMYYESLSSGDVSEQERALHHVPRLAEYVNILGADVLRTCGFQESKIKKKFLQQVGESEMVTNRKQVRGVLEMKEGNWYSLKQVKEHLSKAYNILNIECKAFASDINKFYMTKRARRSGVEGFIVVGEF